MIKLKDLLKETELSNSQGEQTDFKKGDLVKDINPDCPHHGSEGEVTKVNKETITYEVTNNGSSYKEGDELEKTVEQMVKLKESLNEVRWPDDQTSRLLAQAFKAARVNVYKVNEKRPNKYYLSVQAKDGKTVIELQLNTVSNIIMFKTKSGIVKLGQLLSGSRGRKLSNNLKMLSKLPAFGQAGLKGLKHKVESVNEAMTQTITGNKRFMKNVVLPMMRKAAITKVKAKEFPSGQTLQLTFSAEKGENKKLLDLLKKKAGKKGSMKRKKLNLTVKNEAKKKGLNLTEDAAPRSAVKRMEKMANNIVSDMKKLNALFQKAHRPKTTDSTLYNTFKEWVSLVRKVDMKYGGWFDYVRDSDYVK